LSQFWSGLNGRIDSVCVSQGWQKSNSPAVRKDPSVDAAVVAEIDQHLGHWLNQSNRRVDERPGACGVRKIDERLI
jgi:hypothetical protein